VVLLTLILINVEVTIKHIQHLIVNINAIAIKTVNCMNACLLEITKIAMNVDIFKI